MANNYSHFSASIEDLTPEAREWIEKVLGFDWENPAYSDNLQADEAFRALLSVPLSEKIPDNLENWPEFQWEIHGRGDGDNMNLWLYSEESYDAEHVVLFVQALIRKFMPDYIFVMTSAETCSKPRIGEFGGGWLVVSKDEVLSGNTWDAAEQHAEALRTGDIGPGIEEED